MASFTIQLRNVIDVYGYDTVCGWFADYDLRDYLTADEIEVINLHGTWDRIKLARKIVDHYYMREIGLETPELFRHQAKVLMQELMEVKAPLIYSAAIKYDPLVNVDFTETFAQKSESASNNSGLTVNSDTPAGQISKDGILQGNYASTTSAGESDANGRENTNYTKTMRGNSGVSATAQKMVQQYRENIIEIDNDIIRECNKLFMGIY